MKTRPKFALLLFAAALFFGCKKDDPKPSPVPPFEQDFPIVYAAQIPGDKLPWPQHDPTISQGEYEKMVDDLFIINNFGQYQCGDTEGGCYFHDGLDIVLDNGTPIFAVEAGTVRTEMGGNQFYRTLVVEDADEPGMGWAYTHVYFFGVRPGEEVVQGQYLGKVNFQGVEHIHLSRVRLDEGGDWSNYSDLPHLFPDDFFEFKDESPPVIDTPFQFYQNNANLRFEHDGVDTVSGEVDIVVRMRDVGQYANGLLGNNVWGDRLAVRRIEYSILKDGETLLERPSFDFSKMEFRYSQERWQEALTVFKFHLTADPDHSNFNRFLSPYILTNARDSLAGEVLPADADLAWNTLATDGLGAPVFPNGEYKIEVRAWDSHGNFSSATDAVFVKNE